MLNLRSNNNNMLNIRKEKTNLKLKSKNKRNLKWLKIILLVKIYPKKNKNIQKQKNIFLHANNKI